MKLHSISLGCQMSTADADEMSQTFRGRGFSLTADLDEADAVLISTCTVRQHAEDRALSLIGSLRPWKEERPSRLLIVAGCAAERLGEWLRKRFSYIDLVVGARSIDSFPQIVEEALGQRFDALREDSEAFSASASAEPAPRGAFVTIMRGCNYSCSYCIVPAVRGREIYRPIETILAEIGKKTAQGAKEIMLLGQTVNSYRWKEGKKDLDFADLLRRSGSLPGVERLRFMSPHPHYINDRMIAAMKDTPSVCESLHLPVQSGSDRILKMMRRNYTRRSFLEGVERVRSAIPQIEISTDIIVGFPTETEEDFQSTLSLLSEMDATSAYCFKYSPRTSTESAGWPDDVPREVKEERLRRLNRTVDEMVAGALRRQLGADLEVLTEREGFGRTRTGFRVGLNEPVPSGQLVRARIENTSRLTLAGTVESKERRIL